MTQNQLVKQQLQIGTTLDHDTARVQFGIGNLWARIAELRREGVFITTVRRPGTKAAYELARPNKNFIAAAYQVAGGSLFRQSVLNQNN